MNKVNKKHTCIECGAGMNIKIIYHTDEIMIFDEYKHVEDRDLVLIDEESQIQYQKLERRDANKTFMFECPDCIYQEEIGNGELINKT